MPADGAAWTDLRGVINMTQKMRILLLGAVSIAGFVMGLAAWVFAAHMVLLGNWLPSSVTMCGAAGLMSVSERASDRLSRPWD